MKRAGMRWALVLIGLLIVAGLADHASVLAAGKGDVNIIIGTKALKKADWEPVDSQGAFGAEVTWGGDHWPIRFATDILGSSNGSDLLGTHFDGQTSELAFGLRKIWEPGAARPYVGGGIARITARIKNGTNEETDAVVGGWVGGGIFWRLGSRLNIGIAGRVSSGKVTLSGQKVEAGGTFVGGILGWGWPAKR